ncbi:putative lipid-transfer protein DIR1 [Elaeis guineensis]|uniref:Lipid-transfer protein DIR1 n=1 Tax=Elaeis guineensis var. tenera TaxID=51953 RepID=A0A6I9QGC8_ELAGV|nr:putative lipid-transfer protein DIR1 [Elaeis guineensis]
MEKNLGILLLALVAVLVLLSTDRLAAASDSHCRMTEEGLLACLPSITGSRPVNPSVKCCTALSKADLRCLCHYKNSPMLSQLGIKPQLAMQLPAKCKLRLPRQCK